MSEDTYICTQYVSPDKVENAEAKELETFCNSLAWFREIDPSKHRQRVVVEKNMCEAIYYPPEGVFSGGASTSKTKMNACESAFEWFDKNVDATFPSNGCYRVETMNKAIPSKNTSYNTRNETSARSETNLMQQTWFPGGYECKVTENQHACLLNNKSFSNFKDAESKCKDSAECKYVMKVDKNYYLRKASDTFNVNLANAQTIQIL